MTTRRRHGDVSVVIPMYNESAVIADSIATLGAALDLRRAEVILVDDGSTDGTAAVAESVAAQLSSGRVIRLDRNRGKGAAVRAGMLATTRRRVCFMDADMSTCLDDLEQCLDDLERADIVIGSRAAAGARVQGSNLLRIAMGRTFNVAMRHLVGLQVLDSQCGFKLFRGDVARALFALSECDRFAFDPEVLRLAQLLGYTVIERPVQWTAAPRSAVRPLRDSARTGADLLRIRWSTRSSRVERRLHGPAGAGVGVPVALVTPTAGGAAEVDVNAVLPPIVGAESSPT